MICFASIGQLQLFHFVDPHCGYTGAENFRLAYLVSLIIVDHDIFVLYECNQVRVNTVLGSNAPPLTVKLLQAFSSSSKNAFIIENQVLCWLKKASIWFIVILIYYWPVLDMMF